MSSSSTFKTPTKLDSTGNIIYMPLEIWANVTLTSNQYTAFRAAEARQSSHANLFLANGSATISTITANAINITANTVSQIATEITTNLNGNVDITVIPLDPEFASFHEMWKADTTLTWPN